MIELLIDGRVHMEARRHHATDLLVAPDDTQIGRGLSGAKGRSDQDPYVRGRWWPWGCRASLVRTGVFHRFSRETAPPIR